MLGLFKQRKNQGRPWFRYQRMQGQHYMEGQKNTDGSLTVSMKIGLEEVGLYIEKAAVLQLRDWLNKAYPVGGSQDVRLAPVLEILPLSRATRDPEGEPPDTAG